MNYSETQSERSVDGNQESRELFLQEFEAKLALLTDSKECIESTSDLVTKRLVAEPDIATQICPMWASKSLEARDSKK